jgi:hypothetical protein
MANRPANRQPSGVHALHTGPVNQPRRSPQAGNDCHHKHGIEDADNGGPKERGRSWPRKGGCVRPAPGLEETEARFVVISGRSPRRRR